MHKSLPTFPYIYTISWEPNRKLFFQVWLSIDFWVNTVFLVKDNNHIHPVSINLYTGWLQKGDASWQVCIAKKGHIKTIITYIDTTLSCLSTFIFQPPCIDTEQLFIMHSPRHWPFKNHRKTVDASANSPPPAIHWRHTMDQPYSCGYIIHFLLPSLWHQWPPTPGHCRNPFA